MADDQQADESEVTSEITIIEVEPGGEDAPGFYWTFDDGGEGSTWAGPYETEEICVENAQQAIGQAYSMAFEQLFGGK